MGLTSLKTISVRAAQGTATLLSLVCLNVHAFPATTELPLTQFMMTVQVSGHYIDIELCTIETWSTYVILILLQYQLFRFLTL